MRRSLFCIALAFLTNSFSPAARCADKAGATPGVPIETLIARLGDKNFRVRQAAGKALEDRGEEALPALRTSLDSNDEEIRQRVRVLTQKIERSVLLTPKRVTLSMKDRTVEDIVKELSRQSGYKLQYQGGQPRKMTVEMTNATYWQAMEKICNEAGLSPGFDETQGLVYLYQQDTISPYTFHNGPFHFVATNFNYNRYVNLANLARNGRDMNYQNDNSLNFGFMIQAEPKVPLLSVSPPRLTKAEDENGVSLMPRFANDQDRFNVQYYDGNGLYRNFQHSTNTQLSKPSKEATRAKIVRGKVTVTILSGTRPDVVFDKLAIGKKKVSATGSTVAIDIEDVVEQNKTYTLTMIVKKQVKNGEQQDYNWINGVQQKMELLDAAGGKYQSQGVTNFINNSPTSVHATYQFVAPANAKLGPAVKLVYNQWLTISHELDFEFKDLPLP